MESMRRIGHPRGWLAVVVVTALSGCALIPSDADRLFAERDFEAARDAYLETLERQDDGRRVERALYHLGLMYLQPDSSFHDPVAARSVLTRLTYIRPRSNYAAKATMLLALQEEASLLANRLANQQDRTRLAEQELASVRRHATETEAKSQDTAKKVGQLGSRIGRLEGQISKLRDELKVTEAELIEREQELARLKSIDLDDPP